MDIIVLQGKPERKIWLGQVIKIYSGKRQLFMKSFIWCWRHELVFLVSGMLHK